LFFTGESTLHQQGFAEEVRICEDPCSIQTEAGRFECSEKRYGLLVDGVNCISADICPHYTVCRRMMTKMVLKNLISPSQRSMMMRMMKMYVLLLPCHTFPVL
jgi:hypothetical protein